MIQITSQHQQLGILLNQTDIVNELLDHYVIEEDAIVNAEKEPTLDILRQLVDANYNSFEEFIAELMVEYDLDNYDFLMNYSDWGGEYSDAFVEDLCNFLLTQLPFKESLRSFSPEQIKNFNINDILKHTRSIEQFITYENSVQNQDITFDKNEILKDFQEYLTEKFEDDIYSVDSNTKWILISRHLFFKFHTLILDLKIPYILYKDNIWLGFNDKYAFNTFVTQLE